MSQLETRTRTVEDGTERVKVPSVLVVLVAKDGEPWLPLCLSALSHQTHPRIGILAIDNGSADRSALILESALGSARVIRMPRNVGFAGAVGEALRADIARQADYVLLLHDDTMLAPEAVTNLIDAAERVDGVGVVGPKVLDWSDRGVLREIGLSTDRFGYPYSPLEDGEIDQGQYDRIREVRFVSSCAMLISRNAWTKVGPPDERFDRALEDLDFCWRAQVAGFHVLMTPRAVAYHREATVRGERTGSVGASRALYHRERAALASILKNYGLVSLLWIVPLYFVQGLVRVVLLALSRRFEDAYQVLAAWGWNVAHLPGTIRRRIHVQAVRAVSDRSVRRSMAPAGIRLRQWAVTAASSLVPRRDGTDEVDPGSATSRLLRFGMAHPVATAWTAAVLLLLVGYRNVLFASRLSGGGLAAFPAGPSGFFSEFVSGLRHTGLGGTEAASPGLGLLGLASVITFGNPALLQKMLVTLLPVAGAVGCYRGVRAHTKELVSAVVAAATYGLSSLTLWAFSQGRLPVMVFLAGLPWMAGKIAIGFERSPRVGTVRWVVGAGLGLAVLGSFFPAVVLAALLITACTLVVPPAGGQRLPGLARAGGALALAAVLGLPVTLGAIGAGSQSLADQLGVRSFGSLLRLSPGGAPGTWPTAYALPLAAALALVFAGERFERTTRQAALAAVAGLYLAWASSAGYLPLPLANTSAYLGVAAFEFAMLIGLGLFTLLPGVARVAFGRRQLAAGLMAVLLAVGLGAQAIQVAMGSWLIGSDGSPAAYVAVNQPSSASFRVLWLGAPDGEPFPSPGGLPERTVTAGAASVRFAVTASTGASALDLGRLPAGAGYDDLERALTEILSGSTRHGGALLAPFGIRFVVAMSGDLPRAAIGRFGAQIDLDLLPTQGLTIMRDGKAVPDASSISGPEWRQASASGDQLAASVLPAPRTVPLAGGDDRYSGSAGSGPGLVLLAQQFSGGWRLRTPTPGAHAANPVEAFGWAVGFPLRGAASSFTVTFEGQRARTIEVTILALLWFAALWLTRRPARGG